MQLLFHKGNEYLHAITTKEPYQLRIDMKDKNGSSCYTKYQNFRINNLSNLYQLTFNGFEGDCGEQHFND